MRQVSTRSILTTALCGLLSGQLLSGQSSEKWPTFEGAVDVHVSPRSTIKNARGGYLRGTRYELRNATMIDLIRAAYGVDPDKVLGGPSWLETDRFDVIGKAPAGTPSEKINQMLQSVLAERFNLVLHPNSKPMPAYVLSLPKGGKPKMREADGSGSVGCQGAPQPQQPGAAPMTSGACRSVTMDSFVRTLRGVAGPYLNNAPILNQTNLDGKWDFEIRFTPRPALGMAGADAITLFDAMEKQLGLKLDLQQLPTPVVVVDSVNQKPTENAPGVTEKLPPAPPAEFEVATLKPSLADTPQRARIQNGRLEIQNMPLKTFIQVAWDINGDEMLANAPKWLETARYELVAKAPIQQNETQADIDTLKVMLQNFLKERFKLQVHYEDQPRAAFNLVAAKPKLTKADPANRTGCKEGVDAGVKDPRDTNPLLSRVLTCKNMSMAQFADLLQTTAGGYVHSPVLDETGIEGGYDFMLAFTATGVAQAANNVAAARAASGDAAAYDPNGALSLSDAISRQLGLKLESVKRPVPVLVIDHMDEKPTEN